MVGGGILDIDITKGGSFFQLHKNSAHASGNHSYRTVLLWRSLSPTKKAMARSTSWTGQKQPSKLAARFPAPLPNMLFRKKPPGIEPYNLSLATCIGYLLCKPLNRVDSRLLQKKAW